jgi:hypothetical protein
VRALVSCLATRRSQDRAFGRSIGGGGAGLLAVLLSCPSCGQTLPEIVRLTPNFKMRVNSTIPKSVILAVLPRLMLLFLPQILSAVFDAQPPEISSFWWVSVHSVVFFILYINLFSSSYDDKTRQDSKTGGSKKLARGCLGDWTLFGRGF